MPRASTRSVQDEHAALAARRAAALMYDGALPAGLRGAGVPAASPARIRRLIVQTIRALRFQRRAAAGIPPATIGATTRLLRRNLRAYRAAQRAARPAPR